MASGIAKWVYRYTAQDVYPWNVRLARELPDGSPFGPREAVGDKDARTLARDLLGMSQDEFTAAFRGSPTRRAKLRGLKRNAAVALGNVGTAEDVPVLEQAPGDPEPLVREHAAWALARVDRTGPERRHCPTKAPRGAELDGPPGGATVIPTTSTAS